MVIFPKYVQWKKIPHRKMFIVPFHEKTFLGGQQYQKQNLYFGIARPHNLDTSSIFVKGEGVTFTKFRETKNVFNQYDVEVTWINDTGNYQR